jgi:[ribosomal protein S5]-alanine N-acetyltransferase
MYKLKEIRTRRLVLRSLKASDYAAWFDAYANRLAKQNEWDSGPVPARRCSRLIFKRLMKKLSNLARADDYYRYGVFERKSGKLVGQIDIDVFVRGSHQFANFGYQMYNRHWGLGYGQEAAAAGLRAGFRLKLNRLEAAINFTNKKSIRLAKAIGMKREGIKKRYWYENGKWVDHLIYVANPEDIKIRATKPK